jgi:NADPH-ferrihemoprotein reductase
LLLLLISACPGLPRAPCPAGKDEYHSYVLAAKRSLLEVMQDFTSARPSLGGCPPPLLCVLRLLLLALMPQPNRSDTALSVAAAAAAAVAAAGAFFGSVAPHLQPRFYSISSAPQQHPRSVHMTCAVVKEAMPSGD